METRKILCLDANQDILKLLSFNLEASGYRVETSDRESDAMTTDASLILYDPALSRQAGLELLKAMNRVPTIVLAESDREDDLVLAFELGAADYVTKPFSMRELLARIKAVLRRSSGYPTDALLRVGPITIDSENYEAFLYDEKLILTLKEYELLKLLAETPGKVLTRDYLLDRIWGYEFYGETRTVDVHIRHIRMKLGDEAAMIETVRGVGYRLANVA